MTNDKDKEIFREYTSIAQRERRENREKLKAEKEQQARISEKAKKRRMLRLVRFACFCAIAVAMIFAAVNAVDIFRLQEERDESADQLAGLEYKRDDLQQELNVVESDEYVEQQARSELRMIYEGETLYVVKEGEGSAAPGNDQVKP